MIEKKRTYGLPFGSPFFCGRAPQHRFSLGRQPPPSLPFFPMRGRWAQDAVFGEKTVLNKYELFRADLDNAVGNAV